MSRRRAIFAWGAAGLLAALAVCMRLAPLPDASDRLAGFVPETGRRLEVFPLRPWEAEYFGAARATRWLAQGRGPAMILTVVDGSRNRRAVHDPAFCFRGAGWTVREQTSVALPHGEAALVRLSKPDGSGIEAVYWFTDGRVAHGSPTRYWMASTWRRLTLGASGPEPLLVLLVPVAQGPADWQEWLARWPGLTGL